MKKKVVLMSLGTVVAGAAIIGCVWGFGNKADEKSEAHQGSVSAVSDDLNFVAEQEDGLSVYKDDKGVTYYFKGDKLKMVMMPDTTYTEGTVTKEEISALAQSWLADNDVADIPEDLKASVVEVENIGYDYVLSQKIGGYDVPLVTLSFLYNGNVISGIFNDDCYVSSKERSALSDYNAEDAKAVAINYLKEMNLEAFSYVYDGSAEIEEAAELTVAEGRLCWVLSFIEKDGIERGTLVYVDASDMTPVSYDQTK